MRRERLPADLVKSPSPEVLLNSFYKHQPGIAPPRPHNRRFPAPGQSLLQHLPTLSMKPSNFQVLQKAVPKGATTEPGDEKGLPSVCFKPTTQNSPSETP